MTRACLCILSQSHLTPLQKLNDSNSSGVTDLIFDVVDFFVHLKQVKTVTLTFVKETFVLVTFVHIRNISAVTDPILTKLCEPTFLYLEIIWTQNFVGPHFFDPKFYRPKIFGPNFFTFIFLAPDFWTQFF